jgi:hypothetical protein
LAYYGKDFVKSRLLAARRSGTQMNYIHRRASICILLILATAKKLTGACTLN